MNWNKGGPGVKRGFGFGGFSLAGKKEEPELPQRSHTSFGPPGSSGGYGKNQQLPSFYKIGTKRANFDEENAWVLHTSHTHTYPYIYVQFNPRKNDQYMMWFVVFNDYKTASLLFSTRYFEDDEEESSSNVDLPYIPAENSPTRQQMQSGGGSDSEDDPLDAFMAEVEVRRELQLGRKKIEYASKCLICCFFCVLFPSSRTKQLKTWGN